ncbi:MAG: hypothetical protein WAM30_19680 [Candidatus Dormiibacterota bacterium]
MRPLYVVALILLVANFLSGQAVNLFVSIPAHHPGTTGSDYFSQSQGSVTWALTNGAPLLQTHVVLSAIVAILAVVLAIGAVVTFRGRLILASLLGLIGVVAARFNGASFLDFNLEISSMIMSCGLALAFLAYLVGLLWAGRAR